MKTVTNVHKIILGEESGDGIYHADGTRVHNPAVKPTHQVIAAGEFTTAGGDADEAITVAGMLATDLVFVNVQTAGATPRTIVDAAAAAGQINVDMSGDPSTDHVLSYMVLRAIS